MPQGTAVAKAETALKKEASKKGMKGRRADHYIYGALNNSGMKRGNKTTKKGARKLTTTAPPPARTLL